MRNRVSVTVETSEGECEVSLLAMGGVKAAKMGVKIVNVFGGGIAGLVSSFQSGNVDKAMESANALAAKLSPDEFMAMQKDLFEGAQARIDGEAHDMDAKFMDNYFSGHSGSIFKLMYEALKLNFSSFFQDLGLKLKGP